MSFSARIIREPLLHFLLAGAVLFVVLGRIEPNAADDNQQITVTAYETRQLATAFQRTWNRPPAPDELQAQVQDLVREKVLYRTAIGMGLDKDDVIIRRRLRQKLEFVLEDTVAPPQEAELRAYFHLHPEKFRSEATASFRQIFISRNRGSATESDARDILARLKADAPAEDDGDAFALGEGFSQMPIDRIALQFGETFAHALAAAPQGRWTGPIDSPYGLHLILITSYEPVTMAPFEQVRAVVEREWLAEHRTSALEAQYQALRAGFQISVQQP